MHLVNKVSQNYQKVDFTTDLPLKQTLEIFCSLCFFKACPQLFCTWKRLDPEGKIVLFSFA